MTLLGQIFAGIAAVLLLVCIGLGIGVYHYRTEAADYARDLVVAGVNKATCDSALDEQRKLVEAIKLKPKEPKVITKPEYRDKLVIRPVDKNITREECSETSAHIDAMRRRFP